MSTMSRWKTKLVPVLSALFILISIEPASAATEYFSSLSTGCSSSYPAGSSVYAMRYKSTVAVTITAINVSVGINSTTGYTNTKYFIFSDSATTNIPASIQDTFTADSIVGTGSTTVIRYVGNHIVQAGDKFWVAQSAASTTISTCYKNVGSSSDYTVNGIAVDTVTSSLNGYRATAIIPLTNATSWNSNQGIGYFQMSLEGNPLVTTSSIAIRLNSNGKIVTFGQTSGSTLRADVSVDGKVTFFQNKKRIPGCINISSNSLVATCNWVPNIHGASIITATLTPTNISISNSSSSPFSLSTIARSNKR